MSYKIESYKIIKKATWLLFSVAFIYDPIGTVKSYFKILRILLFKIK